MRQNKQTTQTEQEKYFERKNKAREARWTFLKEAGMVLGFIACVMLIAIIVAGALQSFFTYDYTQRRLRELSRDITRLQDVPSPVECSTCKQLSTMLYQQPKITYCLTNIIDNNKTATNYNWNWK